MKNNTPSFHKWAQSVECTLPPVDQRAKHDTTMEEHKVVRRRANGREGAPRHYREMRGHDLANEAREREPSDPFVGARTYAHAINGLV